MIEVQLDTERIRSLCGEEAITMRELGACIGASGMRMHALLNGKTAEHLTLLELFRLGGRLGVDWPELVRSEQQQQPSADLGDTVRLHALLARVPDAVTRRAIADVLQWDLHRVQVALRDLDGLLQGTGEVLHRTGTATVKLRPRDSCLSEEERRRADRLRVNSGRLNRPAAQLLLRLVESEGELSNRESTALRDARKTLVKHTLANVGPHGELRLHPDVAFSLGLTET